MINSQIIAQKLKDYLGLTHGIQNTNNLTKFKLFSNNPKNNFILIVCNTNIVSVYDETNSLVFNIAIGDEIDDKTIRSTSYKIDKFFRNHFLEKQLPSCIVIHDYIALMAKIYATGKITNQISEKNFGNTKSIFVSLGADDQNKYKMYIIGISDTDKIITTSYNVFRKNNIYEYANDDSMNFFEYYIEEGDIQGYAALLLKTLQSPIRFI